MKPNEGLDGQLISAMTERLVQTAAMMMNNPKLDDLHRRAYRGILENYVPLSGFVPGETVRVLDIGVTSGLEVDVVVDFFRGYGLQDGPSRRVEFKGVDIRPEKIEPLGKEYSSGSEGITYSFECADAQHIGSVVNDPVDVVTIWHPDIIEQPHVWNNIFRESAKVISKEGVFIACCFTNMELGGMVRLMQHSYKVLVAERNKEPLFPYQTIPLLGFESADYGHVVVARKRGRIDTFIRNCFG